MNRSDQVFFSVVMSVYNETPRVLCEAITSILRQTWREFEFIVILDDAGNLRLQRLLESFLKKDERIRLLVNTENIGLAKSLNRGIREAQGAYIVRMDADDISLPHRLDRLYQAIKSQQGVGVFFSRFEVMDQQRRVLWQSLPVPQETKVIKQILRYKNIICHSSVAIEARLAKDTLYGDIRICEDYELWVRLASRGVAFHGINEVLVSCRQRPDSMTTSDYYQTYFAMKYIWRHCHQKPHQPISEEVFKAAYLPYRGKGWRFNRLMPLYLLCLQELQQNRVSLSIVWKLMWICLKEWRYLGFIWRSLMALGLRRWSHG